MAKIKGRSNIGFQGTVKFSRIGKIFKTISIRKSLSWRVGELASQVSQIEKSREGWNQIRNFTRN